MANDRILEGCLGRELKNWPGCVLFASGCEQEFRRLGGFGQQAVFFMRSCAGPGDRGALGHF